MPVTSPPPPEELDELGLSPEELDELGPSPEELDELGAAPANELEGKALDELALLVAALFNAVLYPLQSFTSSVRVIRTDCILAYALASASS